MEVSHDPAPREQAGIANASCYDEYYDKPAWWFRFRYDTQIKKRTCQSLVRQGGKSRKGQRVCELGFGSGAFLFSFDRDCVLTGLEISASAVVRAEAIARSLHYRSACFHQIADGTFPLIEGSVDIFAASHVMEHVPDDAATLREIHRVLDSDGIAVIVVPINENYVDPNHARHYDARSLASVANAAGFEVVVSMENETLFYLVERFYFEKYNARWRFFGPVIAAAFNIPASLLPLWVCRFLDRLFFACGLPARQLGVVLRKRPAKEGSTLA